MQMEDLKVIFLMAEMEDLAELFNFKEIEIIDLIRLAGEVMDISLVVVVYFQKSVIAMEEMVEYGVEADMQLLEMVMQLAVMEELMVVEAEHIEQLVEEMEELMVVVAEHILIFGVEKVVLMEEILVIMG